MKIINIVDEDFVNYKVPSMFIITPYCSFKCDKENGTDVCQNSSLAKEPKIDYDVNKICDRYVQNPITHAIVLGGLEPFDDFEGVKEFVKTLREKYYCRDTIVIYTGYYDDEIKDKIDWLKEYSNIIIKYGRFIPGYDKHYDEVLGVDLASDNQYAEVLNGCLD